MDRGLRTNRRAQRYCQYASSGKGMTYVERNRSAEKSPLPSRPLSRRSRLAGEEARKPCVALGGAFAGKPAPTQASSYSKPPHTFFRRSRLAGEEARKPASLSGAPSLASQLLQQAAVHLFP
nr:hypothetical protein FFPRI1PSEUD_04950 [Pseudomonas sp. FFPRI_1]